MDALLAALEPLLGALRPPLVPLLTRLPPPATDALASLLGASCTTQLLALTPTADCASLLLSKALGLAIVGVSAIVKLPQLRALLQSRSARGLSFTAYALETAALGVSCAYGARRGFPFSTYGESALVAAQNVLVAALILHLQGRGQGAAAWVAGVGAAAYALSDGRVVSGELLGKFMAGAGALGAAGKLPQIYTVWKEGGTGQLSAFAVFNYLFGSLARIFTTLQEVPDRLVLLGYVVGFSLNLVLAAQMVYYWNAPVKEGAKGRESEKTAMGGRSEGSAASTTGARSKAKGPKSRRRG